MGSPNLLVNIDSPETIIEWNSNIGVIFEFMWQVYQNGKYQNDKVFKIIKLIFFYLNVRSQS